MWEQHDAVVPDPPTPHPIPALARSKQPATELLQASHDHEGTPRGHAAGTDYERQGNPAAAQQRPNPAVSRDVELLRCQKPTQGEEDGGPAARAQRPQ